MSKLFIGWLGGMMILLAISVAFSYDYYTEPSGPFSYGTRDGFCYSDYIGGNVSPALFSDYADNDSDCCEDAGYDWAGLSGSHGCCGDDPAESWCGLIGACDNSNYYPDSDDDVFACTCEYTGNVWTGSGGEYECCDKGVYDGGVDNYIIRQIDGSSREVVWGGQVLVGSLSNANPTGICQNGVWTEGFGALCVSDADCTSDHCSGDDWIDWSCINNHCEFTNTGCSVSHACAECCVNNPDCYYSGNPPNYPSNYVFEQRGGSFTEDKYWLCDWWNEWQAPNLNSYDDKDNCPAPTANEKVSTDLVTCTPASCAYCAYRCNYQYNPNICVLDYDGGQNKCTVFADIPCESDAECDWYPDIDSGATCIQKPTIVSASGPISTSWCQGNTHHTDAQGDWGDTTYDADGYYDCDRTTTTESGVDCGWGCAAGYYCAAGNICRARSWSSCKTTTQDCDPCLATDDWGVCTSWSSCTVNVECGWGCPSGSECHNGCCRSYTWSSAQTYTAYHKKRCRDVLIYKNSDTTIDGKYTERDSSWTSLGTDVGAYNAITDNSWNYNLI